MQLPRVVIAAVFFVIGALIAVPALIRTTSSSSQASGTPTPSVSTPGATTSGPRRTTTPTRTTARPTTTSPRPTTGSPTTTSPVQPLLVTIGSVSCPGRTVAVTIKNQGRTTVDYTIDKDDNTASRGDRIGGGVTRTTLVTLREDRATRITVTWMNEPVKTERRTANCTVATTPTSSPSPTHTTRSPKPEQTPERLPHTGPDTVLWARAATGLAAMVTGVIIFWYGGVWPRRRDQVFSKKTAG